MNAAKRPPRPARGRPVPPGAGRAVPPGGGHPAAPGQGRPLPPGGTLYTPGAGQARSSLERSSARMLLYLHQLPRWLTPLVLAALLIAGLAVHGWAGAAALLVLAVFLGWLAALSWPRLTAQGRLLRVAALCCLLALAIIQAVR